MDRPSFPFVGTINFTLNEPKFVFSQLFEKIKLHRGYKFIFDYKDDKNIAYGNGASKQAYNKLMEHIIKNLMVVRGYFMDINTSEFWNDDDNIKLFVLFVGMFIDAGCVLPYHFMPALLEEISKKKLSSEDLEFFVAKIDSDLYNKVKNLSQKEFAQLESNYANIEECYKDKVYVNVTNREIYKKIALALDMFDSFSDYECSVIDQTFSGNYTITPDNIMSILFFDDENYSTIFRNFISNFSENELRQLLLTFGNTLCLNNQYHISVRDNIKTDLEISVCRKYVIINKKVMDNPDNLDGLRHYFCGHDQIADIPQNHTQNSGSQYSNNELSVHDDIFQTQIIAQNIRHDSFQQIVQNIRRDYCTYDDDGTVNAGDVIIGRAIPPAQNIRRDHTYRDNSTVFRVGDVVNTGDVIIGRARTSSSICLLTSPFNADFDGDDTYTFIASPAYYPRLQNSRQDQDRNARQESHNESEVALPVTSLYHRIVLNALLRDIPRQPPTIVISSRSLTERWKQVLKRHEITVVRSSLRESVSHGDTFSQVSPQLRLAFYCAPIMTNDITPHQGDTDSLFVERKIAEQNIQRTSKKNNYRYKSKNNSRKNLSKINQIHNKRPANKGFRKNYR